LDLAPDRPLLGEIGHACELLRDRASPFARAPRHKIPIRRTHDRRQIEAGVLIEVAVFDGDDRPRQIGRHVLRGELVALEYSARGEDLTAIRLDDERARRRLDRQSTIKRHGGHAIGDIAKEQNGDRSEQTRHRMRATRLERPGRCPAATSFLAGSKEEAFGCRAPMRETRASGHARATENAARGLAELARKRPSNRSPILRPCAGLLNGSVGCGRRSDRSDNQPIVPRLRPDVWRAIHPLPP
jgi:hypothetical protein